MRLCDLQWKIVHFFKQTPTNYTANAKKKNKWQSDSSNSLAQPKLEKSFSHRARARGIVY